MAILLKVDNPSDFLKKIYADIDDKSIDTWKYNEKGNFTHSTEQWFNEAWINPVLFDHPNYKIYNLCFRFVPSKKYDKKKYGEIYGIYHGRFAEMLIIHYPKNVKALRLTPCPLENYDIV